MTDSKAKAYHNFCRMSPANYQELLNLVTPLVSYLDIRLRKAISADERLAVTLRYLATGMSTQYRMPPLDWYLQGHVVTTITRFLQNSTGFQCTRELCSRLVVLVWKCLNGTAPGYLSELCVPVASAHFQETTESLSVPHLMCWRREGTFTTARRCCGVFVILAPDIKLQTYLLITQKAANTCIRMYTDVC